MVLSFEMSLCILEVTFITAGMNSTLEHFMTSVITQCIQYFLRHTWTAVSLLGDVAIYIIRSKDYYGI